MGAVIILIIFGLIVLTSASGPVSRQNFNTPYFFLKNQIIKGILIGLILGFIAFKVPYQKWQGISFWLFLGSIILLTLIFVPSLGVEFGGAKRWLNFKSFLFQPSEIAKLTFIIYLAAWASKKGKEIKNFQEGTIPFLISVGIVGGLILLERDLGTVGILTLTALFIFFAAGVKISHFLLIILVGLGALGAAIIAAPYRFARLKTLLNPNINIQGASYQINQSLIALGSGGIFGLGLGNSRQKWNFLPQVSKDSIGAIIGEELGFLGLLFLIILFLIFVFRGLKIAKNAPDNFGRLMAIGISSWLTLQAFINLAAISGLIPLTGVPLPFVSYGGTAMAVSLTAVGILLNISKSTRQS